MHKGKSIGGWERFDMTGNLNVIDSGADPYPTEPEDSLIDDDIPF